MQIGDDLLICERTLQQVGNGTLNVNLPAKWLQSHNITKDNYKHFVARLECSKSNVEMRLIFIRVPDSV